MFIYFVYILASERNGTLYLGVTNDLERRVMQHREGLSEGFTKMYRVYDLVWYQEFNDIRAAIQREKQLKAWKRDWKLRLIEETNLWWHDLAQEWGRDFMH